MSDRTKRLSRAAIRAAVYATLAIGIIGAPAFAVKPIRDSGTSSFRVDDGAYATTTTAYRGSSSGTWVRAKCYQGGSLVYEQYVSYSGSSTATLTLGPTPSWSSGGASCTAEEGYWRSGTRWTVVGRDSFTTAG